MFLLRQAGEGRRLLGLLRVWVLVLTPHFFGTPVANAEQVNTRLPQAARQRCAAQADRDHMVGKVRKQFMFECVAGEKLPGRSHPTKGAQRRR
jgi:hypothetical protein